MSSTETGAIFGNIVYESTAYADRSVVVLNDIHIDIMDYISPASCPDVQFRSMWAEFEWENKVGLMSASYSAHMMLSDWLRHVLQLFSVWRLTAPNTPFMHALHSQLVSCHHGVTR